MTQVFYINFEKSSIEPSHSTSRLYLEPFNMSTLPNDKIIITRKFAHLIHNKCSLRETISFLELVGSNSCAFKFSPLHYRPIQLCYIDNVNRGKIIMIFLFVHLMIVLWMTFLRGFLALIFSILLVLYHFTCKDCVVNYV